MALQLKIEKFLSRHLKQTHFLLKHTAYHLALMEENKLFFFSAQLDPRAPPNNHIEISVILLYTPTHQ